MSPGAPITRRDAERYMDSVRSFERAGRAKRAESADTGDFVLRRAARVRSTRLKVRIWPPERHDVASSGQKHQKARRA